MSRLSRNAYIQLCLEALPIDKQTKIREYCAHAQANGARMCNDKFPDTRFKATYLVGHNQARWWIDLQRHQYRVGVFN